MIIRHEYFTNRPRARESFTYRPRTHESFTYRAQIHDSFRYGPRTLEPALDMNLPRGGGIVRDLTLSHV